MPKPLPAPNLHDLKVPAPDKLNISGTLENERAIAEWWLRTRLYCRAMNDLDRIPVIAHLPDEDRFYLASIPAEAL